MRLLAVRERQLLAGFIPPRVWAHVRRIIPSAAVLPAGRASAFRGRSADKHNIAKPLTVNPLKSV
jgi:hypothetical protein